MSEEQTDEQHWSAEVVMPALLRFAWRAYGGNVRAALAEAGYDDLPRNGAYVVGGMAHERIELGDGDRSATDGLAHQLGVSKQAVSQLIDTLVMRGYLVRAADPADRRRMTISLTERGEAAAHVIATASEVMDGRVADRIGDDGLAQLRRSLGAVIDSWDPVRG